MDFRELKKNRGNALKALQKELDEKAGGKGKSRFQDPRFWQPEANKLGNGGAIIRFLPDKDGGVPYKKEWSHWFKGPGGVYSEKSLTTIGEKDPVGEYNSKLWNSGREAQAREQKRKLTFISNILVVKDAANQENNGKVFLYKYGKKIFEKIENAINPEYDNEGNERDSAAYDENNTDAFPPFDFWEGANFRLIFKRQDGFRNYDQSKFDSPSPIAKSDEDIEDIFNQLYSLSEFDDPKNFKSYDELEMRLKKVLGETGDSDEPRNDRREDSSKMEDDTPDISSSDEDDDDDIDLDQLMKDLD